MVKDRWTYVGALTELVFANIFTITEDFTGIPLLFQWKVYFQLMLQGLYSYMVDCLLRNTIKAYARCFGKINSYSTKFWENKLKKFESFHLFMFVNHIYDRQITEL